MWVLGRSPCQHTLNSTWHLTLSVMTRWYRAVPLWYSREHAAITTLPSEGHQNALVNAPFVFEWEGGSGRRAACTASATNSPGWKGGLRKAREGRDVKRSHCTPGGFTFGMNKVWKPTWGRVKATETYQKTQEAVNEERCNNRVLLNISQKMYVLLFVPPKTYSTLTSAPISAASTKTWTKEIL